MRLIRSLITKKFQEAMIYKNNVLINFAFGLIPLFISIYLWKAIYGSQNESIAGYNFPQMITYFSLAFIIAMLTNAREIAVNLSGYIKDGTLNNYLLKPVNFITYQFRLFFAEKIVYLLNIFFPFALFILLVSKYLYFNLSNFGGFVISVFLSLVLNYIIYFTFGILTIWLEEISALLDLWGNITAFLSGGIFPLTLLPDRLFAVVSFFPFKYMVFTPIDIYMGRVTGNHLLLELLIQFSWTVILAVLLRIIWAKAIRMYSGYGS